MKGTGFAGEEPLSMACVCSVRGQEKVRKGQVRALTVRFILNKTLRVRFKEKESRTRT